MGRFTDSHIDQLWTTPASAGFLSEGLLEGIASIFLLPSASAYIESVSDVFWLGSMPTWIAYHKELESIAKREAKIVVDGRDYNADRNSAKYRQEVAVLVDEYLNGDIRPSFIEDIGVEPRAVYQMLPKGLKDAYASIMKSQIVLAWSAFETLAGDLFKAVAVARPDIAEFRSDSLRIQRLAAASHSILETESRVKAEAEYAKYRHFGGKASFSSLGLIRASYSRGFWNASDIDAALGDLALDRLAEVRHALVHSGGKADQKYLDKASFITGLPKPRIGEAITIDGYSCCALYNPVLICGKVLIQAVDDWLKDNT